MTGTKLTMNVWETNLSAAVFAVQGEAGSRQLDLTLIEDSGAKGAMSNADVVNKPLDLTGVTTPRLYIVKPDGTKVFSDGKVTDAKNGKVSFVLSAQALAASGKADCQIVLTKANGETLKIIGLMLDIKPSDLDDAVESQDDYGALQEMVALIAQTQQEAAAWLKDANIQFDALLAANSTELDAWLADAANQAQAAIDANDAAFETWFETLQEKLSGNVAANLQAQLDSILTTRTTSTEKPLNPVNFTGIPTLKATAREDITGTASTRTITISCSTHLTAAGVTPATRSLIFNGAPVNPATVLTVGPVDAAVWTNALDTAKTVTIDAKTYKLIAPLQIQARIINSTSSGAAVVQIQAMIKVGAASPSWQPLPVDFFTGAIPEIQFRYVVDVPLKDSNLTAAQGIRLDASQVAYKDTSLQAMLEQLEALLPN